MIDRIGLLAIDPGIDQVGGALFDPRLRTELTLDGAARALLRTVTFRTSARTDVLTRCAAIAEWVADLVEAEGISRVVIELPSRDGGYRERVDRQRTKGSIGAAGEAKLNRAIGAVAAGAHLGGARISELPASRYQGPLRSKEGRRRAMETALHHIGRGPLGGNQDTRDAAFLGAFYLCIHRGS